ncbi:hypothetical protein [Brevibacillus parabrevis]|uniref:hypothetical protein n=1 Tax=Brevibacillus parabrevis TaxID=54914 RepID=UPI00285308E9|nr:hypothetical protein [Brevibacillus parabrevis]MDR5001333.1 hypothetical protein [Brevibacillus parabrevis]
MALFGNILAAILLFAWAGAEFLFGPAPGKWRMRLGFFLGLVVISGVLYWGAYWLTA